MTLLTSWYSIRKGFMTKLHRPSVEVSTSSMADIAFLLLTFFLVTTVIPENKGILITLPPLVTPDYPVKERNVFTIQVNSFDKYLVEGIQRENIGGLRDEIKRFILNNGKNELLSENPTKAVVAFKSDRGTSHGAFIGVLDEIQSAYFEIYAHQAGITPEEFRKLDLDDPAQSALYDKGRSGIPMNVSISEPTRIGIE